MASTEYQGHRFNAAFGDPPDRAVVKLRPFMHPWVQDFIRCSPFVVLATSDGIGRCSASPRGGVPGFVRVLNDRSLLLPDLPGNFLFQSYAHIDKFNSVGLVFFVPGLPETVRVSGSARIIGVEEVLSLCGEDCNAPAPPLQGLLISVDLAYGHCGRSVKLSNLWDETTIRQNREKRPVPQIPAGV